MARSLKDLQGNQLWGHFGLNLGKFVPFLTPNLVPILVAHYLLFRDTENLTFLQFKGTFLKISEFLLYI